MSKVKHSVNYSV